MLWVMVALLLVILGIVLRVLRWKIMIKSVSHLSFTHTLGAMLVSFFADNVLPFRTASFVTFLKSIFQINSNPGKDEGNDADKSVSCKKGGIDPGHVIFGDNRIFITKKSSHYQYPRVIDNSK
jgi:hypothetical protein